MKPNTLVIILLAASVYGCTEPPPPKSFSPFALEGLVVPGRFEDAKMSGFTDCEPTYYSYTCKRTHSQAVFGVEPLATRIELDGAENLLESGSSSTGDAREIPPEKLSYRQIYIELRPDVYDEVCVKDGSPTNEHAADCVKVKGTQTLMTNLRRAGWVEKEWRSYTYFLHDGIPVEVSVERFKNQVTIRPETIALVKSRLADLAQAKSDEQKRQAQANAVLKQMKE